jgi:PAS domain S-box-containing protein
MNALAVIPLAAAVGIGFLGAVLFAKHARELSVRIFTGYCAMGSFLSFVDFQLRSASITLEGAEMWLRARCLWPLALTMLFHFLLLHSGICRKACERWPGMLIHVPALVVSVLYFRPGTLSGVLIRTPWGYADLRPQNPVSCTVSAWVSLMSLLVVALGLWSWLSARAPMRRRQAKYIALGTSIRVVLGFVFDGLLPALGIQGPPLSSLGTLTCALLISHAVRKLKLFVASPAEIAEMVLAGMSDLLFLTDADGRIQRTNRAALQMLGCREQDLVGRPAEEVLPELAESRGRPSSVKEMETAVRVGRRCTLTLSLSTSTIRDYAGNIVGMLFLGRDITDRKRAESARQLLVRSMIQAQDEERRRIARELHDETGQVLGSLIAELRVLEDQVRDEEARLRIGELRNLVTVAMQEVQRISRGMHPGVLDALGLAAALRHYAEEFSRLHGIKVTTEILGLEGEQPLPPEINTTLYRVVQEALTNVARHAEAKVVSLYVVRQEGLLRTIIEDDGKGFDTEAPSSPGGVPRGLGLLGIQERVGLLGGSVRLETAPGEGVTLKIELPLERKDD